MIEFSLFPSNSIVMFLCVAMVVVATATADNKNVVMITVDDLRPQLNGAYDMTQTITPNLDKFATESTVFHRAYCQMAVCSPSRNSFMSGRRPDTTKVWNFIDHFREPSVGANWTALPQYFKENGYMTYASGKLFHPSHPPNDDYPTSWTNDTFNPYYWGNSKPIGDAGGCNGAQITFTPVTWSYGSGAVCNDVNDTESLNDNDNKTAPQTSQGVEYDHRLATRTIEYITHAKSQGKNFFVGVGFRRPHLAWRMPKRFWDMYEGKTIDVAKMQTIGNNITVLAYEMNGEMGQIYKKAGKSYQESPQGPSLPTDLQRALRRGYYASVTFMDFEVGRIMDALDAMDLTKNTAVLFHADHGWKLGEHGDWSKCTNWELDTRVPLIIRAPWITSSVSARTMAMAELVDIFPTLVDLSGLPPVSDSEKLEGISLVPVLEDPSAEAPHNKTAAFSQYPRCPQYVMEKNPEGYECLEVPKENITRMGFSVRLADARYTEWRVWMPTCEADWTAAGLVAQELYNHSGDMGRSPATFDDYEYENLAYKPESQSQVKEMASLLDGMYNHHGPGC
eukprot:m.76012 g.76012  ORF g.76012 m.76012 type:complete len:564 (-) comp12538_c0_seq2:173-1864(-)